MTFFTCFLLRSQVKLGVTPPPHRGRMGVGFLEGADVSRQSVRLDVTGMLWESSQTVKAVFYDRRLFAAVC